MTNLILQGRTSKPDSPNAPPSCSTTATITGRVFYNTKATCQASAIFSKQKQLLEKFYVPPFSPYIHRSKCSDKVMFCKRETLGMVALYLYLLKNNNSQLKSIITWLATSTRALAFSLLENIDLSPPETAEKLFIARALNANKMICRSLQ